MKYWLHSQAMAEHRAQVVYYEQREQGLGRRYHDEFRAAMIVVCEAPHRQRVVVPPDIRCIGLKVFPFDIMYREVDGVVQVLTVAAHRRRPNFWLARI